MSEMESEESGSDDQPNGALQRLQTALVDFTACIGTSLEDICSYGYTIGETYVPFDPDDDEDCDEDDAQCSQAWVRTALVNPTSTSIESFGGQDCYLTLRMQLEVGVLRCIDIPEGGEAPTTTDVLVAGMQSIEDMNAILCAALSCEVFDDITVGQWTPTGPLGGQYGGIWTFTVEF